MLEKEMEAKGLDIGMFVEVKAKPSERHPMRGVIAAALYETPVEERRGRNAAKNGVVCVQGNKNGDRGQPTIRILEQDTEGRWMLVDMSGVILCIAYIAPSETVATYQGMELAIEKATQQQPNAPIILAGDFNIRLRRFGDTTDTRERDKREWMEELVDGKGWIRVEPIRGRNTTKGRSGEGGGVTDLIFTNAAAENLITDLVVHDGQDGQRAYAHSDHNLLTFNLRIPSTITRPAFKRLNIRKLCAKPREYAKKLSEEMLTVKQVLRVALKTCEAATRDNTALSADFRQRLVDTMENQIVTWMTSAAQQTAGYVKFRGGEISAPLNEEHVNKLRAIYEELHHTATTISNQRIGTREARIQAWREVKIARAVLKRAVRRSRKRLFDAGQDNWASNAPGDAKRIACAKRRSERTQSALEPNKTPEYVDYFRSTIGHAPTATAAINQDLLNQTDPDNMVPRLIDDAITLMPREDIEMLCMYTARGKATGDDGVFGEMLAIAPDSVTEVLTDLFWLIITTNKTPTRWNTALVALVWKKKGSNTDIANYRPISLISRIRMIFEGALRPHLEKLVEANIDPAQGGFRPGRSTLDQVIGLHEIIAQHKGQLKTVYLDIKAAYDCIDRRLLWTKLAALEHDSNRDRTLRLLIPLLRQLFDRNSAVLLVAGSKSEPLPVTRGLLQGTVLAPMLFNIYINDLPQRLRLQHPTIQIDFRTQQQGRESEMSLNSLFFADDAAIFTRGEMQPLLTTCDQWGQETGTTWAPTKCEAVGVPAEEQIQIAGVDIPKYDRKNYLGIIFSKYGVEMRESIEMRVKNGHSMLSFLKARGFNGGGMRYGASRRHYFSFIRSMAEYGLALKILSAEERKPLEKLQQRALTTLFSVSIRSSTVGLRAMLGVTSIKGRNELLHAQFIQRLHMTKSSTNTAAIIYRTTINTRYPAGRHGRLSFLRADVRNNIRWQQFAATPLPPLIPPVLQHRVHGNRADRNASKPAPPIPHNIRNDWYFDDLQHDLELIQQNPRGARTTLLLDKPPRREPLPIIKELVPRSTERPIVLWMLGVAISRDFCSGCATEIDSDRRQHAVLCAEVGEEVRNLYTPPLQDDEEVYRLGGTMIDIALRDQRTWHLDRDHPTQRRDTLERLEKLARIINKTRQHFTGVENTVAASSASASDEIHALLNDLDARNLGRRFNRLRNMLRNTIRQHFSPITAAKIREPAPDREDNINIPPHPTQTEIDEILHRPEHRHLLR